MAWLGNFGVGSLVWVAVRCCLGLHSSEGWTGAGRPTSRVPNRHDYQVVLFHVAFPLECLSVHISWQLTSPRVYGGLREREGQAEAVSFL